jgi:CRP-like cAMP-binding protein
MALFNREIRMATVRALGEVRVLTVDKRNLMRRIHEDPSLAYRIILALSQRIRELSDDVVRLDQKLLNLTGY